MYPFSLLGRERVLRVIRVISMPDVEQHPVDVGSWRRHGRYVVLFEVGVLEEVRLIQDSQVL